MNDSEEYKYLEMFDMAANEIHMTAIEKGWDCENQDEGKTLMLIVSELAEGLEGLRGDLMSDKITDFKMIEEELADAIIRIKHYAKAKKYRVGEAVLAKMKYNQGRSYKHGNKKF